MKTLMVILQYALLGAITQNVVFAGGIGSNRLLRWAKWPKYLFPSTGLLFLFMLATSQAASYLRELAGGRIHVFLILAVAVVTVFYFFLLGTARLLSFKWRGLFEIVTAILPTCAYNCIVLSIPLMGLQQNFSVFQTMGYCVGAAAGFLLAVLLVRDAMTRLDNPQMEKAFTGLPALLIYVGILSMAFMGFTGKPFMFL